jgi:signal transduction histidine kinase
MALAGWALDIKPLIGLYPGLGAMKITTALCFVLAGAALWWQTSTERPQPRWHPAHICAAVVATLGFLTLIDDAFRLDLSIDALIQAHANFIRQGLATSTIAPTTSLNLFLIGSALLLLDVEVRPRVWITQAFCFVSGLLSLVAFIGRLYGVPYLYGFGTDVSVAFYSAATSLSLSIGILCSRPEHGVMAVVSSDSDGGILARRLLPSAFGVPLVLGWLALRGYHSQLESPLFRLSLLIVAHILVFTLLIWWDATFIYKLDIKRRSAEEGLRRYAERLQSLLELGRAILSSESAGETAHTTISHLREQLACPWAGTLLFDSTAGEVTLLAVDAEPDSPAASITPLQPETSFPLDFLPAPMMSRLQGAEPVVQAHPAIGAPQTLPAILQSAGLEGLLILPLCAQEATLGCLVLANYEGAAFSEESLGIAREVADRLALGLQQWRLFEQVRTSQRQLQILSHRLMQAQEMERRGLARELHDEIGQSLTAIRLNLQTVQRLLDSDGRDKQQLKSYVNDGISIAETVLQQVRNLSLDLRPSLLDDLGLVAALRWYADRQAQRTGLEVNVSINGLAARLPADISTTCFRVAQEALTNIVRHAAASRVDIELDRVPAPAGQHGDLLQLVIRDNGIGFDVRSARQRAIRGSSLGLLGMEERVVLAGGRIDIRSCTGQGNTPHGTTVRVSFPLTETPTVETALVK